MATSGRTRGVAVRADDPAVAPAAQSESPPAGSFHVDRVGRSRCSAAVGVRAFGAQSSPRRLISRPTARPTAISRSGRGTLQIVIAMELLGVRVEVPANTPVVILREQSEPHRVLPILIGSPEASAIHTALSGIVAPRPMTHDLI